MKMDSTASESGAGSLLNPVCSFQNRFIMLQELVIVLGRRFPSGNTMLFLKQCVHLSSHISLPKSLLGINGNFYELILIKWKLFVPVVGKFWV